MLVITPQQRRELRAKAHHLHPVVSVGQHGLTPTVLHEIDVALNAHGLVKIRVFSDARDERDAMLARIADELAASPVQHLGKLLIVYRPVPKPAVKKAARRKAVKKEPASAGGTRTGKQAGSARHAGTARHASSAKAPRRQKPNAEREFAPIARRKREDPAIASGNADQREAFAPKGRRQRSYRDGAVDAPAAPAPRAPRKRSQPSEDTPRPSRHTRGPAKPHGTSSPPAPAARSRKSASASVATTDNHRQRREQHTAPAGPGNANPANSRRRRRTG